MKATHEMILLHPCIEIKKTNKNMMQCNVYVWTLIIAIG